MGQVAFDTLKFVETLESAGLPKDQAKAISVAVRESHEAVDVATKRDLEDVRKDLSTEIADVRKDLTSQIALLRKDVENISTWLVIKMGSLMAAIVGVAAAFIKFF